MGNISYIYWDIDPVMISWGPVTIRWYGLFFALAFLCGYGIMNRIFENEKKALHDLDKLFYFMMVGTLIGARLGHCFFYDPVYYLNNPLEILKIWKGGLASHGGVAGILTALFFYARQRPDQNYLWVLDRISIPAMLGGCLIRVGNLFNSEIVGVPTTAPWAVIFQRFDEMPRHPVQLYESMVYGTIFLFLFYLYGKETIRNKSGWITGCLLVCAFSARFFLEFLKTRQAAYGGEMALSTGQLLSIPMVMAGFLLLSKTKG